MFPPNTPKSIYDPPMKPYDHEAVSWFTHVYPRLIKPHPDYQGKSIAEHYGMVELLQKPGETVFVPGGWPHIVLNLGE
jgi:histone arginine demethylase JMJD6